MAFKALDPELARKLIAQHVDIITPAAVEEAGLYKHSRCPVCGHIGAMKVTEPPKIVQTLNGPQVVKMPFSSATPLVAGHAKCETCNTEYSPMTGVIIRQPEPVLTHPGWSTDE